MTHESQQQFELFDQAPWVVRLKVPEAMQLWWDHDWSKTKKSRATRAHFRRIVAFWARKYIDELCRQDVVDLRGHLEEIGHREDNINTHHTMVTRSVRWYHECYGAGERHGINWRRVPLPVKDLGSQVSKVDEEKFADGSAWPKRAVLRLIAECQRQGDQFMADVIESFYIWKLRPGDYWEMTDRNVDWPHRLVTGIQSKSVTRLRPSGLPYTKVVTKRMAVILRRRMKSAKPGEPLYRDALYTVEAWSRKVGRRFAEIRAAVRMPHVKLKHFRPSAATLELDAGIDPLTVSQGLGHTSLRMLPVYAKRTTVHLRHAQELLEDHKTEILMSSPSESDDSSDDV